MPDDNLVEPAPTNQTNEPSNENAGTSLPPVEDERIPATNDPNLVSEIINKINESENILIALSSDPSVDELCSAIGLSLFLDKIGKRATAIYSGATPNALEFLKPEETFEPTVDTLQDFVIAINKEKADHLRYKLDGEFVKIYITPYRTRVSEKDLEFAYGDFNVDLVFALDVANGIDLDSALREHGRIMHDAVIVNITTGNPGKLGEIEWSDKTASSISEMIAELIYNMGDRKMEKDEATAFLTGIVAATDRFSNLKTSSECMRIASLLMDSGADQQLISKNISTNLENQMYNIMKETKLDEGIEDPTKLDISHASTEEMQDIPEDVVKEDNKASDENVAEKQENGNAVQEDESGLLDDLKKAQESLTKVGAETIPGEEPELVKIDTANEATAQEAGNSVAEGSAGPTEGFIGERTEKVIQPIDSEFIGDANSESQNKYGQMLEEALADISSPNPADSSQNPPIASPDTTDSNQNPTIPNPAAATAPQVPVNPEINGIPQINYMPLPGEEVLPPPPAPPINPILPASPSPEPTPTPLGDQPAMQDQVYNPQSVDPGAFKIPGL